MFGSPYRSIFFFFNDTATTEIYTLSLHDALPISPQGGVQIGALTKLAEIAESDLLAKKYPMLVQAVKMISSDRKSTRLNSSHVRISYAAFCLKKKYHDARWQAPCAALALTAHLAH